MAKKSTARKRNRVQLATDLKEVQERLNEGWSWRRIGVYMNSVRPYKLNHVIYFRQYQKFVSNLNKEAKASREEFVEMQLSEINELKTELWNSWLLSKGEQEIKNIKSISEAEVETTTKEWKDAGNHAYLTLYTKLMEREAKLLGLDKPEKKDITSGGKTIEGFMYEGQFYDL